MSYLVEWLNDGFINRFSGEVTLQSILESDNAIFSDKKFATIFFGIYDFQKADLSGVKMESLIKVASADSQKSHSMKSFRFAVVATDHAAESVCESYKYLAELTGSEWEIKIFKELNLALNWCQKYEQG